MVTTETIERVAAGIAIAEHRMGRWQVTLWPDGRLSLVERGSNSEWSRVDGVDVPILLTVGAGSCPCTCDACAAGISPEDAVGDDDVSHYAEEIKQALAVAQEAQRLLDEGKDERNEA